MNKPLQKETFLLNKNGEFLRKFILDFDDEDLKKIIPSPSPDKIQVLFKMINKPHLSAVKWN